MKHKFIILFVFILCTSFYSNAQRHKATLYFKDGRILEGLARVNSLGYVKYKKDEDSKKEKIKFQDLDKVSYYSKTDTTEYSWVTCRENQRSQMLMLIEEGPVRLYRIRSAGANPGLASNNVIGGGVPIPRVGSFYSRHYYLMRKGETEATNMYKNKMFRKDLNNAMQVYFEDCPALVKKIKDEELDFHSLIEIVQYYNRQCANNN